MEEMSASNVINCLDAKKVNLYIRVSKLKYVFILI